MSSYYGTSYGGYQLYHHGILGMKWGVRRFQNPDGTLTEEGKKRYDKLNSKIDKQEAKIRKLELKREKQAIKSKPKAEKYLRKAGRAKVIAEGFGPRLPYQRRFNKWRAAVNTGKYERAIGKVRQTEAKIDAAKAFINKYDRKMSKLNPKHISRGYDFVAGHYQKKLSDLEKKRG